MNAVAVISQLLLRHDLELLMVFLDVPADQWDHGWEWMEQFAPTLLQLSAVQ